MSDLIVANEIRKQIGGGALYMIGAKNFVGGDNFLQFKIMKNDSKINLIKIELNDLDLYDITFYNFRGLELKKIGEVFGYYADMLCLAIRDNTGLATSL